MAKPLSNITVLEMGTFITGPATGMLLADLGATVIKIEQPKVGDPFRAFRGGNCRNATAKSLGKVVADCSISVVAAAASSDEWPIGVGR